MYPNLLLCFVICQCVFSSAFLYLVSLLRLCLICYALTSHRIYCSSMSCENFIKLCQQYIMIYDRCSFSHDSAMFHRVQEYNSSWKNTTPKIFIMHSMFRSDHVVCYRNSECPSGAKAQKHKGCSCMYKHFVNTERKHSSTWRMHKTADNVPSIGIG